MEVRELIKELEKQPQYAAVYISKEGCKYSWMCTKVEDDDLDIDCCITLTNGDTEENTEDTSTKVETRRCTDCDWMDSEWKDYYDGDNWEEIKVYTCQMNGERLDWDDLNTATNCGSYYNSSEDNEEVKQMMTDERYKQCKYYKGKYTHTPEDDPAIVGYCDHPLQYVSTDHLVVLCRGGPCREYTPRAEEEEY
jgi:hypothetical protein